MTNATDLLTYAQWLANTSLAPHIGDVNADKLTPGDYVAHNGYVIRVDAIRPVDPQSPRSYRTAYGTWTEAPKGHNDVWIAGIVGSYVGTFRNEYPEHMRERLGL